MATVRLRSALVLAAALLPVVPAATSRAGDSEPPPCTLLGTDGPDELMGTDGDDVVCGFSGADVIRAGAGNDVLRGAGGNDSLYGEGGDDSFFGGPGSDRCGQGPGSGSLDGCEKPNPFSTCPVPGGTVTDSFGDPRPGGRKHQGIDILADMGDPILAPFDGISDNDRNDLGGKTVYVFGSQGYVYNAHLSKHVAQEGAVEAGDMIGYVGMSGNARGTTPHNHFEWHPGGGDAIDPYRPVKKVC
jgi:murein DD-endopeptidase MepM/ murein hydrolase activator NlpD